MFPSLKSFVFFQRCPKGGAKLLSGSLCVSSSKTSLQPSGKKASFSADGLREKALVPRPGDSKYPVLYNPLGGST